MPSVYVIYGIITDLTRNMTLYCKASNSYGDSSESIDLYLKRINYIDEITVPQGKS